MFREGGDGWYSWDLRYYDVRLTSGLYTSYWNAFLLFSDLNENDLTLYRCNLIVR